MDRGQIRVHGHDRPAVAVEARARGLGANSLRFALERHGYTFVLRGTGERWLDWLRGGPRVEVRVWVPPRFSVEADSSAGAISVRDVRGAVRVRTTAGRIHVEDVAGPVDLRSGDGPIELVLLDGAGARLDARSDRGAVHVEPPFVPVAADGPGHRVGAINGGGPVLRLRTRDGRIRVGRVPSRPEGLDPGA